MFDFTIIGLGYVALGIVLTLDILLTKHRPVSAVLWLAVVWAFPYGGALAYLSVGIDRVRRGAAERDAAKLMVAQHARLHATSDEHGIDYQRGDRAVVHAHPARHIFRATDPAVQPFRISAGNAAELLVDGDKFYPALFAAIKTARSSIHLQTFILARGQVGSELMKLLIGRAREGVECRVLYDRFGSMLSHFTGFFDEAKEAGVQVRSISQANPLKGRFQINLRNHRKIVVIDGKQSFVGGINIQDKNTSRHADETPIRDYHVRIEGPAVSDLQFQFVEDWHFATRESPDRLLDVRYFPRVQPAGDALVQVVPGGPELRGRGLADAFFGAIVAATRFIDIVTPYFVPDETIVQAIRHAAIKGIQVRIVVPRKSNHWYTGQAARSLYTPLLKAGVRIFERKPPFMHAKAMIIDGVYAMVGSANLDQRSLHLNFELNVEVADDPFVRRLGDQIEAEIANSIEVILSVHQRRPIVRRLTENFCYLFQPML
ncbi:MAG: cardiolipin synthase [Gemmatimonadetes bacterium]|uniref:Cardiolipin synthase n=1 Tax=Candidatus Kutchimonas denitrificans TaxID=3056748 RepID=A0AAE4ZAK5_9BACT|nr:cardiolipin synthase [Gemmatimonadota bacterium]NIR76384.1 cardiolipin synthase [Candidatus Kutchimonas denitrificans]NIS03194.1 cardiolipin synthase [Gemmatimonadota bacterium]NIT66367.1 cardiolipin synthase [Gemmatimonadota bacterium]NIU54446.1 cardiolipin synthase [Gemmatimonadota bacterium]